MSKPEWTQRLIKAVRAADLKQAEHCLQRGADINGTAEGQTPLIVAADAYIDSDKVVQLLLERKADIHVRDEYGATAVIVCAKSLYVASLQRLLTWPGMAVNAVDHKGNTALIHVINQMALSSINLSLRLKVISLLLKAGADTTIRNQKGQDVFACRASVEATIKVRRSLYFVSPAVESKSLQTVTSCFKLIEFYHQKIQKKISRTLAIRESSRLIEPVADLVSDYDNSPPAVKALVKLSIFGRASALLKLKQRLLRLQHLHNMSLA